MNATAGSISWLVPVMGAVPGIGGLFGRAPTGSWVGALKQHDVFIHSFGAHPRVHLRPYPQRALAQRGGVSLALFLCAVLVAVV